MLKKRNKKVELILIFSLIIIICIFAIYEAIYTQFYKKEIEKVSSEPTEKIQGQDIEELEKKFNDICDNKFDSNNANIDDIEKKDSDKELVYTDYYKKETTDEFDIDVTIPKINIKEAENLNNKINSTFIQKAESIQHNEQESQTRYTVKYTATITDNILSIVVDATLKEKEDPQRRIMETYNFDLEKKQEIKLEELLSRKNLQKEDVQNKIKETIKNKADEAEALGSLGYEIYKRDLRSDMYEVDEINNFYYGKDGILYIIFAYGNNTATSEKDIIIF